MSSYTEFTFKRKLRSWKRKFKLWRTWLYNYLNRHLFGSWQKLGNVRWTFAAWIFIILVSFWGLTSQIITLNQITSQEKPKRGGIYKEALVGQVKSLNPLFPENNATESVVSLVFSGLTKVNGNREIVSDLAEKWEVSEDRKNYTFYLRKNATWHDGVKVTSNDIAFTVDRVQNPDTRSPYSANWNGVKYQIIDETTIRFSLPSSYGNFLYNTTLGILPKHRLDSVASSNLRSYEFNQRPIGTGPYKIDLLEVDSSAINLKAYEKYYIQEPYISDVIFALFQDSKEAIDSLIRKQVDAVSQVPPEDVSTVEKIQGINDYRIGLPAYVGAFFNTKNSPMNNLDFRKALALSTDREGIVKDQLYSEGSVAYYPIPAGFVGFNPSAEKYQLNFDKAKEYYANSKVSNGTNLRLVTLDSAQYKLVANKLAEQWRKLGVNVEVITADISNLQQNYIRSRNYDILLYGQNIGIDSDVYSFWHSSQINDPGLNISNYKNADADKFLEAGRLAKDQAFKASRYSSFVDIWSKDVPAVIIYSPYYNYAQSDRIKGFDAKKIAEPSNRFYNIYNWYLLSN
ncbi:peptide-binding protein [Candidatus Saccharibacteria bacterium]|nr:peptide-binding protein [Candidatus Saccharibacteria bacterium]